VSLIVKTPDVCGGRARLVGSRMPVWTLVAMWKRGASDEDLLEAYPWLTQIELDEARDYSMANEEEIDRDIADQEAA
jgi:type III restriction enzyme